MLSVWAVVELLAVWAFEWKVSAFEGAPWAFEGATWVFGGQVFFEQIVVWVLV